MQLGVPLFTVFTLLGSALLGSAAAGAAPSSSERRTAQRRVAPVTWRQRGGVDYLRESEMWRATNRTGTSHEVALVARVKQTGRPAAGVVNDVPIVAHPGEAAAEVRARAHAIARGEHLAPAERERRSAAVMQRWNANVRRQLVVNTVRVRKLGTQPERARSLDQVLAALEDGARAIHENPHTIFAAGPRPTLREVAERWPYRLEHPAEIATFVDYLRGKYGRAEATDRVNRVLEDSHFQTSGTRAAWESARDAGR